MGDCLACDLFDGSRPLPGGRIFETERWVVEHCVGPLGAGTLIVKPKRHVTLVADLDDKECAELGPLLRRASEVAQTTTRADQVYNCLWSHAGGVPVHLHYVIQPVTAEQMAQTGLHGPALQVGMFTAGQLPDVADVEAAAAAALAEFAKRGV